MTNTIALIERLEKADETWQTYAEGCIERLKSQGLHSPEVEATLRHSLNRESAAELTTLLERCDILVDLLKNAEIRRDKAEADAKHWCDLTFVVNDRAETAEAQVKELKDQIQGIYRNHPGSWA